MAQQPRASWAATLLLAALLLVGVAVAAVATSLGSRTVAEEGAVGFSSGGGLFAESPRTLERDLSGMQAAGATWLRVDVNWAVVQRKGRNRYSWGGFDRVIRRARAHGLNVLANVAYTPSWARPRGSNEDKVAPALLSDYVRFAEAAVRRYRPLGVRHWELWNEPNLGCCFWRPVAQPERYARLVRATGAAIKRIDPGATVLAGALAPASGGSEGNLSPLDFARRFYAAGAAGSFDVLSVHPYTWPHSPTNAWPGDWDEIAELGGEHGHEVPLWATEFGAPTGGGNHPITEGDQARMATLGFAVWPGYDFSDGPMFWYSYRDAGADPRDDANHFGVVRHDFTRKQAWRAIEQTAAARRE
jgi:hypothetical protein